MKFEIRNRCADFTSYRAARVKSLFNAENGADFIADFDLPVDGNDWQIGVVVGPSGSGKTSIGKAFWGGGHVWSPANWPANRPIVEAIAPGENFDAVTQALAAVGLGDVPAWLRPFHVLSNGEQFRATLARLVVERPARVVVDEFSSVVDRQIARIGSLAFQKSWRRGPGQAVLLTCHHDILDWLEPDWVFDTARREYTGGRLRRRPAIELEILQTDWRYWPLFEPHHYLKLPRMMASDNYVGTVNGDPVCHVATSPKFEVGMMRACRLVVMPEWQGAGVGVRFLNHVCQRQLEGGNRWGRKVPTLFHTSHPALAAALRRDRKWSQCSAILYGGGKARSAASMARGLHAARWGGAFQAGYGGHFRAVQGFKYLGEPRA